MEKAVTLTIAILRAHGILANQYDAELTRRREEKG
jgi:hypothetical protein